MSSNVVMLHCCSKSVYSLQKNRGSAVNMVEMNGNLIMLHSCPVMLNCCYGQNEWAKKELCIGNQWLPTSKLSKKKKSNKTDSLFSRYKELKNTKAKNREKG
ncbi:unnamed protein product [Cuscuta epithymum]|uniref:Uncharacterized protein n=1 Tax=Cuscuta epithymum TaxID=186058 RepID=A0AAV0C3R4_9ASTE|nr:unnamed protein product [Cuscuta epithymum]